MQEILVHDRAHHVPAAIDVAGTAAAVAVEAGERLIAAWDERLVQYVEMFHATGPDYAGPRSGWLADAGGADRPMGSGRAVSTVTP